MSRLGDLRSSRALTPDEIAALRQRLTPIFDSFPPALRALPHRLDALKLLRDLQPHKTFRELNQLYRALDHVARPCTPLLLPNPLCILHPEACRVHPTGK